MTFPVSNPESIDLDIERNVLTVRAERPVAEVTGEQIAGERPRGVFSRQLILGDNLDLDKINAGYSNGVLKLEIPVAEKAKPRKISLTTSDEGTPGNFGLNPVWRRDCGVG